MRKFLYATSRDVRLNSPANLDGTLLNGGYTTEFWNFGQFEDFAHANIVKLDMPIPTEMYTGKIPVIDDNEVPTGEFVPKLTRFVRLNYSDAFTNSADLTESIEKTGANTGVQVFSTVEDARAWVRSNTSLVEEADTPGKFLISPAGVGMMGEQVPAKYLTIV